jgi:hypothetical protein
MTDDPMNLQAPVEKSAVAVFLREMIVFAGTRLIDNLTAFYGEKSSDRLAHRKWPTRA